MSFTSVEEAVRFVSKAILPPPPEGALESAGGMDQTFATARDQAAVVGSDVVSFVSGVTADQRKDLVNSTLLAQLVAKVQVTDGTRIYDWYNSYFDVLKQIGWLVQDQGFAVYRQISEGFEAHEAIIGIATTLLGANPAALAVVKATLDSLQKMDEASPWLTIFNRESQYARTARFQITLAEPGDKGQFLVTLMAFGLEANSDLTRVLFFKFRSNEAVLKHFSGKITVDVDILAGVRDAIQQKIAEHISAYVRALPDLNIKLPAAAAVMPRPPGQALESLSPLAELLLTGVSDEMVTDAAGFREDTTSSPIVKDSSELESTTVPVDWRSTISLTGYQFILRWETGGQAYFEKVIKGRPIWPGYSSGITIGCGFDLGYHSLSEFQSQWGDQLGQGDFSRLVPTIGFKTIEPNRAAKVSQAKAFVQSLSDIVIPWTVARNQFDTLKYPALYRQLYQALDNLGRVHPHCRAALLSLTFNRGPAFASSNPRFSEMREIGEAMSSGGLDDFARIPNLIRAMVRIWGPTSSLAKRREGEATLFEAGLREMKLADQVSQQESSTLESVIEGSAQTEELTDRDAQQTDDADVEEVEDILASSDGLESTGLTPSSVRWNPKDDEQPDYRHLDTSLTGGAFDLTGDDLELLITANDFALKPGKLIFALRGASLGGVAKRENVSFVPLIDQRPDHRTFRCVIGVYDREAKTLSAYQASTVPNAAYVYKCYAMAQQETAIPQLTGNILPTGCYTYTVGTHKAGTRGEIPTVLRLAQTADSASTVVVLRSIDDTIYDRFDVFVPATPADNVHPGQMANGFSSAGCLTLPGFYKNGNHTGIWSDFRAAAGIGPRSDGTQFSLILVTGLDVAIASRVRAGARPLAYVTRLRHGSSGARVAALQKALGITAQTSPVIGQVTRQALVGRQIAKLGWSDGIHSPAMDELLGFGIFASA